MHILVTRSGKNPSHRIRDHILAHFSCKRLRQATALTRTRAVIRAYTQ
jgi:hypothetical protein